MSRPAKLCGYCGSKGITKEHLYGAWSRKLLENDAKSHKHTITRMINPKLGYIPGNITSKKGAMHRPGTGRSQTLRIVCKQCNGGWMKENVDRAIPLLTPLIQDKWKNFSASERTALATWIVQFTMSYEFADRETICVSQRERDAFRKSGGVPSHNWRVAIGRADFQGKRDRTQHRAMEILPKYWSGYPKFTTTAFNFGHLFAISEYCEFPSPVDFTKLSREFDLQPLWPLTDDFLTRPSVSHPDDFFKRIVNIYTVLFEASLRAR